MKRKDIRTEAERRCEPNFSSEYYNGFFYGFIDGAEWRINSVWHDVSEEPSEKKKVIAFSCDGSMIECDFTYPHRVYTWEDIVKISDITMWAYVEDLLPNTED